MGPGAGIHGGTLMGVFGTTGFVAAGLEPTHHDAIPRAHPRYVGTGFNDAAHPFVAETVGQPFVLALHAHCFHHLRAAGAGKYDFDQNLPRAQFGDLDVPQLKRLGGLYQDCGGGFHAASFRPRRSAIFRATEIESRPSCWRA